MNCNEMDQAVSLSEAARRLNIPYSKDVQPKVRHVGVGSLRFQYLEWGDEDKPSVLLLHGIAQQSHSWDLISLSLSNRYHVIALDARGHGETQWPPDGDYSIEAHQRDLDGFVKAIGLDRFIIIGHSMGGRNAYVYTSQHPIRVKALIIVDTGLDSARLGQQRIRRFVNLPDELASFEQFVQRVQEYTGRPSWMVKGGLNHSIRQLPNGTWTWKYDRLIRHPDFSPPTWPSEELRACLRAIDCPTLLVRGADSDVMSPETFEQTLELLPNSRGAVVPNAGHLVPGDNPSEFLKALELFLKSLD